MSTETSNRSRQRVAGRRSTAHLWAVLLALLIGAAPITNCGTDDPASAPDEGISTLEDALVGDELTEAAQARYLDDADAFDGPAVAATSRVLNVGFQPQVPPGDWSKSMSCGPASLNMAGAYAYGVAPNNPLYIPKICGYLGKSDTSNCLPGGTNTTDLVRAAKAVNNARNTYSASGWTLARIKQEIDAGRPVVVAVNAGALHNPHYSYKGGHFVLVVGYDSANMIVNDPGTRYGSHWAYSNSVFTTAMAAYNGAVVVLKR